MRIALAAALTLMLFILSSATRAGLDTANTAASSAFELIVIEADGCTYCGLFRHQVLPAYETSEQGQSAPVRFVDVNDIGAAHLDFNSPVDIVPTFVLVKSNHEVGRISGYVAPEDLFRSVNYLLRSAP
ncbi:thioredoxin family protein [Hyphomicrobium sp.]|jgi:thioredoxin-related protein|uniref:thioredoxin family protein n=1 Tax=Hyphomicrobium sp. TaxID=82 RepID=UPI002BCA8BBA|nr:thioredoxin family protein [Hyphomicrobium sp.]HVZ03222.1 thioredoxin family protein [Hyphomicrobium sp.]